MHHQAKDIESQFHIYQEITCAAKIIQDPRTAATDIDEVVRSIWLNQQPGYIEIHQDMVEKEIEVPREIIEWDGKLSFKHSDHRKVEEAARDTTERFNRSHAPFLIAGIETFRYKLTKEVMELVEKMGVPCATTVLAKGALPTDHPLYMGVHIGAISPQPLRDRVDEADLVLNLGGLLTDMNLGSRPLQIAREKLIWAKQNQVDISYHTYTDVTLRDYVKALLKAPLKHHHEKVHYCDNLPPQVEGYDRRVQVTDVLWELNKFLQGKKGYMVVAESGDMLFAGLDIKVAQSGGYLAQGYYASMGFGVPGALGAQLGTGQRPIVLCGDGAFQMTGPEISQAPRYGLNPIVIVMNNGGWGIFRPVTERQDLLQIPPWPYAELARAWGGEGFRVETVGAFREALEKADRISTFVIIEVLVDPHDLSPVTVKYIRASVKKGNK